MHLSDRLFETQVAINMFGDDLFTLGSSSRVIEIAIMINIF